jgi:hypothetical protein
MTTAKGPIVVFGFLFCYPLAGVTYQFLHYLLALRRLGWDPYYVEDTERWGVYDPERNDAVPDPGPNLARVAPVLAAHGFGDRWAFRLQPGADVSGIGHTRLSALYREAAGLLNVTGTHALREEHLVCRRRIYVESDPADMQIAVAEGDRETLRTLRLYDTLFTFGENLGRPDCGVPMADLTWLPTRQPVALDLWREGRGRADTYTTIATWRSAKKVVYRNDTYYWSKDREFEKVLELPRRRRVPFELATHIDDAATRRRLTERGWRLRDPVVVSGDVERYRAYIEGSRGEFTVAKDQYTRLRTGWFSDRSACYLAAGRPVITQDTGFGNVLPTGKGLFAFRDLDGALAAVDAIESDYKGHCRAARELAAEYFDADRVVGSLLERAGLG